MIESGDLPLAGGVAAVTTGLGLDVVGRFAGAAHRIVAIGASLGGALEGAADVAAFAADRDMGAGQRKAGAEMIEVGADFFARAERRHCQQQCRQQDQDRRKTLPEHHPSHFPQGPPGPTPDNFTHQLCGMKLSKFGTRRV